MRDFDFVMFEHDVLLGLGGLAMDLMAQLPNTVIAGFVAAQSVSPSLTINMGLGRIYQFASADTTPVGSIPQDLSVIVQQGFAAAQTLILIPPTSGQSQWNLIQAQFSQVDAVRTNDPNGGIVPFYNAANPTQPTTASINTVRKGVCVLQVITGSAATTGSEVPPNPTTGWVPLYLIDIAGGQTQITTSQIIQAGPSVGTGVPANYPFAPFLTGLLASHHGGVPGQAPKIKLGSEVQGVLPYSLMSPVRIALSGNLTLYVNTTTGTDTNTGLAPATPFKTLQAAINSIYHNWDFGGFGATVSVANGTYTAGVFTNGVPPGMSQPIAFVGNIANPAAVVVSVTNANCFQALSGSSLSIQGFTVAATGVASIYNGIGAGFYAISASISFSNMIFGSCVSGQIVAGQGGVITSGGFAYAISGGGLAHMSAAGGYIATSVSTVTLTGTPTFSGGFALCGSPGGNIQATTQTFSGSATGPRFAVTTSGWINTGGGGINYFPGNSAGTGTNYSVTPWGLYQ